MGRPTVPRFQSGDVMMPRILLGHGCVWLTLLVGSMLGRDGLAADAPVRESAGGDPSARLIRGHPAGASQGGEEEGSRQAGHAQERGGQGCRRRNDPGAGRGGGLGAEVLARHRARSWSATASGATTRRTGSGKFDMTSFKKLMAGSEKEKVVIPGKPDESPLVLRIKGEETPKMPPGANREPRRCRDRQDREVGPGGSTARSGDRRERPAGIIRLDAPAASPVRARPDDTRGSRCSTSRRSAATAGRR